MNDQNQEIIQQSVETEQTHRKPMNFEWIPLLESIKSSVRNQWNFQLDRVQAFVSLANGKLECTLSLKLQTVPQWDAMDFLQMTTKELLEFDTSIRHSYEEAKNLVEGTDDEIPELDLRLRFVENTREVFFKQKARSVRKPASTKKKAGKSFGKNK